MAAAEDARKGAGPTWLARRGAERRAGVVQLIATAAQSLAEPRVATMRTRFEGALTNVLRALRVTITEDERGPLGKGGDGGVAIPIPQGPNGQPAYLEALLEAGRELDDWERQTFQAAGQLAALILGAERAERTRLTPPQGARAHATRLLGSSAAIRAIRERVDRIAATDFTVLIEGESGTGKELVARQIHSLSRRRQGPFVAINCAALVESLLEAELFGIEDRTATGVRGRRGKFEHADQGTLFLDEVSDLSMSAQAKLLRAIQDMSVERVGGQGPRRIDARIIVATNRRLAELVERGHFRLDLYYRLNGVEITMPPLRDRRDDIAELAECFLQRHRHVRPMCISPEAMDALMAHHWPGNVRQLERVLERAVALASSTRIELDDLPPALVGDYGEVLLPSARRDETMRAWGSRYARLVLLRHGNNKRKACQALGISYHTLQAYLRYPGRGTQTDAQSRVDRHAQAPIADRQTASPSSRTGRHAAREPAGGREHTEPDRD